MALTNNANKCSAVSTTKSQINHHPANHHSPSQVVEVIKDSLNYEFNYPHTVIVFGASVSILSIEQYTIYICNSCPYQGDLATKKIYPTLW